MLTPDEALGAIILVIIMIVAGYLTYNFREERKIKQADRRQRVTWEQDLTGVVLPEWNDWPETGLARYLDATEASRPAWDGATYDVPDATVTDLPAWQPQFYPAPVADEMPETGFAKLDAATWQPQVYQAPFAPQPPPALIRTAGPSCDLVPRSDTDLFIAMMREKAEESIARMRHQSETYNARMRAQTEAFITALPALAGA